MTTNFLLAHTDLASDDVDRSVKALEQLLHGGKVVHCSSDRSDPSRTVLTFASATPLSNTDHKVAVQLEEAMRSSESTVALWVGQSFSDSVATALGQLEARLGITAAPWQVRWLEATSHVVAIHARSAELTGLIHEIRTALGQACPGIAEGWTGDRRVLVVTSSAGFADPTQTGSILREVARRYAVDAGEDVHLTHAHLPPEEFATFIAEFPLDAAATNALYEGHAPTILSQSPPQHSLG